MADEPQVPFPPPEPGQPDPHRPKHLDRAFRKIGEVIRQHAARTGGVRAKKKVNEITHYCDVCRTVYNEPLLIYTDGRDDAPTPKTCQECQGELAQGGVAVIAPDGQYSFVWGAGVVDLPQKNFVSQEEYDAIVAYVKNNEKPDMPMP